MSLLCFVFLFLLTTILFISNSSFCTFPVGCTGADSRDCSRRGLAHGRRSKRKGGATEVGAEGESFVFLYFLHSLMLPYLFHPNFFMLSFQSHSGQQTIHNNQSSRVESKSSLLYLFVLAYITTTDPAYFILLIFVLFQLVVWARTAAWAASKT